MVLIGRDYERWKGSENFKDSCAKPIFYNL